MNAIQHITILPKTATERQHFIEAVIFELENGQYKAAAVWPRLSDLEKLIKEIKADTTIRDILKKEIDGKAAVIGGIEFSIQEVKRYEFATCGDSEWLEMSRNMEKLKEKMKAREAFLKSIPAVGTVCPETGEIIHRPAFVTETRIMSKEAK